MKTPQIEIVENFMRKAGSVSPSHLSLAVDGHRMSYESFCRHLRTLHKKGKLEQRKIERGRVAYDYVKQVYEIPGFEGTMKKLDDLQLSFIK